MVNRHCVWCSMECHGYMVDRHCVWCSRVDLIKWDNVQNESHGFENEKYVCWDRLMSILNTHFIPNLKKKYKTIEKVKKKKKRKEKQKCPKT